MRLLTVLPVFCAREGLEARGAKLGEGLARRKGHVTACLREKESGRKAQDSQNPASRVVPQEKWFRRRDWGAREGR